jgi:hypothetical protein
MTVVRVDQFPNKIQIQTEKIKFFLRGWIRPPTQQTTIRRNW